MNVNVRMTILAALLLTGCLDQSQLGTPDGGLIDERFISGQAFHSPQGIAAGDDWIVVANTAFHFDQGISAWAEGFVTFIDRQTRRVSGMVRTTQPNPQSVVVVGDLAYVVNGGTTRIDGRGIVRVDGGGGVDIFELPDPGEGPPIGPLANIPLGKSTIDDRIGAYGSLVVSPDGRFGYVGSGTRGDVFQIDLVAKQLRRGPDDPIALFPTAEDRNGLTNVRPWGNGLAVLNFNSDELCLSSDWQGGMTRRHCGIVGVNDELVEGPIDFAADVWGDFYVLLTVANAVYRAEQNGEGFTVEAGWAQTGLANNRLVLHDGHAYVLNSLSNNLQRIDLASGTSDRPFTVFPVRSNPFDLVVTEEDEGPVAWVTLLSEHQVALVDLTSGELLGYVEGTGQRPTEFDPDAGPDVGIEDAVQGGSGQPPCDDGGSSGMVGISEVISVTFGPGGGFNQGQLPAVVQGGPAGLGGQGGSIDEVLSLGEGGEIVVSFGEYEIVDEPGPDFIVFENPFLVAPFNPFAEPGIVGASITTSDAAAFVDFPCDLTQTQGDANSQPWPFPGCAGVQPVLANGARNCAPAPDPALIGGDPFDLATLGLTSARYLRIRDAGISHLGIDTKGFDLDAILLINFRRIPSEPDA